MISMSKESLTIDGEDTRMVTVRSLPVDRRKYVVLIELAGPLAPVITEVREAAIEVNGENEGTTEGLGRLTSPALAVGTGPLSKD